VTNYEDVPFKTERVVTGSGQFDIDVTGGAVSGRAVRAEGGAPVERVEVSFFRVGGHESRPVFSAWTDAQGTFSQRPLREGRYRLITSKPEFRAGSPRSGSGSRRHGRGGVGAEPGRRRERDRVRRT